MRRSRGGLERASKRALVLALAATWLLGGCSQADVFRCQDDDQCRDGDRQGMCALGGYCAFDDDECESGLVYGELASPGLAGECVPTSTATGGSGGAGSSSGGGSGHASSGVGPATGDETAVDPGCPAGVGGPCQPADPCALVGICNDSGVCLATDFVTCDAPPGPCYAARGQCLPGGGCDYAPLPAQTPCEDGDPCTVGDACDDAGACVGGPSCPAGPCEVAECTDEGCAVQAAPDGASCGMLESQRCCNGDCVDISDDPAHCGGCSSACAAGEDCESVSVTSQCESSPPETSGRCRCTETAQCPLGQICRTSTPYAGRCTPSFAAECDGVLVSVSLCPNYCSY